MKRIKLFSLLGLVTATLLSVTSCSEDYGDDIDNLKKDVATIKTEVTDMKDAVNVLETKFKAAKLITKVEEYTTAPKGVTITFSDGEVVTIKNGTNGTNGTPGADGRPGVDGQPGAAGKDAIVPMFEVRNFVLWYNVTAGYPTSGWVSTGMNLRGEKGEDGENGQPGGVGPEGPQGPQGETGAKGNSVELVVSTTNVGFYDIKIVDATGTQVGQLQESGIPVSSANAIKSITTNTDGTITIKMGNDTKFDFLKQVVYPASIVMFTDMSNPVAINKGDSKSIKFRVNPSNADVKAIADWFILDNVGSKMSRGFDVTDVSEYYSWNVAQSEDFSGEYTLNVSCIKDPSGVFAGDEFALVCKSENVNGEGSQYVSSNVFRITSGTVWFNTNTLEQFAATDANINQFSDITYNLNYTGGFIPSLAAGDVVITITGANATDYEAVIDLNGNNKFGSFKIAHKTDVPFNGATTLSAEVSVTQKDQLDQPVTSKQTLTLNVGVATMSKNFTTLTTDNGGVEVSRVWMNKDNAPVLLGGNKTVNNTANNFSGLWTSNSMLIKDIKTEFKLTETEFKAATITWGATDKVEYKKPADAAFVACPTANIFAIGKVAPTANNSDIRYNILLGSSVIPYSYIKEGRIFRTTSTLNISIPADKSVNKVAKSLTYEIQYLSTFTAPTTITLPKASSMNNSGIYNVDALSTTQAMNLNSAIAGTTMTVTDGTSISANMNVNTVSIEFGNRNIAKETLIANTDAFATAGTETETDPTKAAYYTTYTNSFKAAIYSVTYNGVKFYNKDIANTDFDFTGKEKITVEIAGLSSNKDEIVGKFTTNKITGAESITTTPTILGGDTKTYDLKAVVVASMNLKEGSFNAGTLYKIGELATAGVIQTPTYQIATTLERYVQVANGVLSRTNAVVPNTSDITGDVTVTLKNKWGVSTTVDVSIKVEKGTSNN